MRPTWIHVATFSLLAVSGCIFVSPTGYVAPTSVPAPSPDVRALVAHLPFPSVVGIDLPCCLADRAIQRSSHRVIPATSYLGIPLYPQLDLTYAGSFPRLEASVSINGQPWWSKTLSCVSPQGELHGFTLDTQAWSPPDTGTYIFAMTLDPTNQYSEVDESNNSDTLAIHVIPAP